ncbi:MAG: carboxypeptidase-like regulatory domain-containing protein, partial [Opitutaceae bacterium]
MHTSPASFILRVRRTLALGACLLLALPFALKAQSGAGAITGRILNEATGQYLRSAVVTVVGTNISTVAESGGAYTLSGVPAGEVRVAVSFIGLDPAEATVKVQPGQTVVHDFRMANQAEGIVKLDAFRVVTEREGNYKAIQEQKAALNIKSVISSDTFGDVSEGNVGEFLKLMPGIMTDNVAADARTVSIGGLDPKYALIMMDGAPVASAGSSSIGTGRTFEFEQLSITSIETVEMSKTPTPDVAGSALAGVINLRSKGAFDRRGRQVRWSTSAGINSHQLKLRKTPGPLGNDTLKLQPNASLEFSDVFFNDRLGVLAGVNFSRSFNEQSIMQVGHIFDGDPGNNATEVPRVSSFELMDGPKVTTRTNYNLRLDYKFTPELTAWVRADYNNYEALISQRLVTLRFNNAINGPFTGDPQNPGVEYSLRSQTSTLATSQLTAGTGFNKHGATTTLAGGGAFKRGAFRADVQAQMSRATNFYHDVAYGFFNSGSTAQLPGLELRWDRDAPGSSAINVTQVSGADWRNPANYTGVANPSARLQPFNSKDQKWTAKADFRYNWKRGEIPVLLKWGGDISQGIRNVNRGDFFTYTYMGPDGVAGTGDERWPIESNFTLRNLAGGNI